MSTIVGPTDMLLSLYVTSSRITETTTPAARTIRPFLMSTAIIATISMHESAPESDVMIPRANGRSGEAGES